MTVSAPPVAIEASRRMLLDELGDPPDLTVVRGVGNHGDGLIWEGTAELLADRIYREVDILKLPATGGHTVLISGGGAFCRPYHEIMPRVLAMAELRFERVIVLPSSFDPSDDQVREALHRTRATVFAREAESYRRIVSLCDARLAHDCAFFFEFSGCTARAPGTLNVFRADREGVAGRRLPPDNQDISVTAPSLEQWLETIAESELVRTDRAHVMIAAAMLGKRVEFAPSAYHKLEAIADYALAEYPVSKLAPATSPPPASATAAPATTDAAQARVTAIVLSRDRPQRALRAIDSLQLSVVPSRALVIDNNSAPAAATTLADGCAERGHVTLRRSDRNLGCAGGRALALASVDTEFVLFIDDDAELRPGALDQLVAELDSHPNAAAVTATVLLADGSLHHSGGELEIRDGVAEFSLIGAGQRLTDELPPSGPAGWVPGTAALFRHDVLAEFPIDERMAAYYEDNEWCYRVQRARPGSFRRSREARAVHHFAEKHRPGDDFTTRSHAVELLRAHAHFYQRHELLLGVALFDLVPELRDDAGARDLDAARLLMELLLAKGTDWTFMQWMNGSLDGLLGAHRQLTAQRTHSDRLERELAERAQLITHQEYTISEQAGQLAFLRRRHETLAQIEAGGWWQLRQRLLPVLRLTWRLRGRGRS